MENVQSYRPLLFSIILICLLIWEIFKPYFRHTYKTRLTTNFVLFLLGVLLLKVCFPFGIFGLAQKLNETGRSVSLNSLPFIIDGLITVIIFDLGIYWQHKFFHTFKRLWKFHAVHHSDKGMDFSSAIRFHPGEILLSGVFKIILILIFLPRAETYLLYEIILSSFALFNHSNIYMPERVERFLRLFIVTPQMHYTHHSPKKEFTNSNYGNFLSIWDKLFKTYRNEKNQVFGLEEVDLKESMSIKELILHPFKP